MRRRNGWILALFGLVITSVGLAVSRAQEVPAQTVRDRMVYVPYDKLSHVLDGESRGVFLSYAEFQKLWSQLQLTTAGPTNKPPRDAVLSSAQFSGVIQGSALSLQGKLTIDSLVDEWTSVPLGENLAFNEFKQDRLILAPRRDGGGIEVLVPGKGQFVATVSVQARLERADGASQRCVIHPPAAGLVFYDIVLPGIALQPRIVGARETQFAQFAPSDEKIELASLGFTVREENGSTRVFIFGSQVSHPFRLEWAAPSVTASEPLLFADNRMRVDVHPDEIRTEARLGVQIDRAPIEVMEFRVSKEHGVTEFSATDLREWSIAAEGEHQRITARFNQPVRGKVEAALWLRGTINGLPGTNLAPVIEVIGAAQQSGRVAFLFDPSLEATISDVMPGITRTTWLEAEFAEIDVMKQATVLQYFRAPYRIPIGLDLKRAYQEVRARTTLHVLPDRLKLDAVLDCRVKRGQIYSVLLEVPAGFDSFQAEAPSLTSQRLVDLPGGGRALDLRLGDPIDEAAKISVTSERFLNSAAEEVLAPVFFPRNADQFEATVKVVVDPSLDARVVAPGGMRQEDVREQQADQTQLAFWHRGSTEPARLAFEPRKPRVSTTTLARVGLNESSTEFEWTFRFNTEFAGVDVYEISVPKEIADAIRFDGADIREKVRRELVSTNAEPARVVWKIALRGKRLGLYELKARWETPQQSWKPGEPADVVLPDVRAENVFRETGEIAVTKDGNFEIVDHTAPGLDPVDPRELNSSLGGGFLAFRFSARPIGLTIKVVKNTFLPVPDALVSYAVFRSVVAEDQSETVEVVYWVRNNTRQFLSVLLPAQGRMLSDVFVEGKSQQPARRQDRNELLIRLPSGRSMSGAFPVRFIYEVPSGQPGSWLGLVGTLSLQPPKLLDTDILQTRWNLYLPSNYRYLGVSGPLRELHVRPTWDRIMGWLARFVPLSYAPFGSPKVAEPPALTSAATGGFDFQVPIDGTPIVLAGLDAPSEIRVSFQYAAFARTIEAFFFFGTIAFGLWLTPRRREEKFLFAVVVGLGAMMVAGAITPRAAGMWHAIVAGVGLVIVAWLLLSFANLLRRDSRRTALRRHRLAVEKLRAKDPLPPVIPKPEA